MLIIVCQTNRKAVKFVYKNKEDGMKRLLLFFLFSVFLYSEEIVNYKIKAKLFPEEKIVKGEELIIWKNSTSKPTSELYFHLYLNAFRNELSTFMREAGIARFKRKDVEWGYCEIKELKINGVDLKGKLKYVQPDDGNIYDKTLAKIPLDYSVNPGDSISISIIFESKLPKVIARSGYSRDFFMVAQWFPKIAVLREEGWNAHQYHRNSEFFSDFGKYEVEIRAPEKFNVVASGVKIKEVKEKGEIVRVFHQDRIHDFAWSTSPNHRIFEEVFSIKEPEVNTKIILFLDRDHLRHKGRYFNIIKKSIEFFSKNYGPYPYKTITVVDPPSHALQAGGMEYPTLITAGSFYWLPKGLLFLELVTLHEFGHQYWYGMCANNEFEEAWLDEGINSYSEVKGMVEIFGEKTSVINFLGFKLGDIDSQRLSYISIPSLDPIYKKSYEFFSGGSYSANSYAKSALMLLTLERYLGKEVFSKVMKEYFQRFQFKHPKTEDFIRTAEEVSGKDLDWFFNAFLFSDGTIDYKVERISTKKLKMPEGIIDMKFQEEGNWESEVLIVKEGSISFPVNIEIVFEDGKKIKEFWDGKGSWKKFKYVKPVKVKSVEIDPEGILLLDRNRFNNSMTLRGKPDSLGIGIKLLTLFQSFLFSF